MQFNILKQKQVDEYLRTVLDLFILVVMRI